MKKNRTDTIEFLVAELQNGQERAFDFVFRKYYKALCAQANLYVNDLDKAQSLVQDCFIKLWNNRKTAGNIKNLSAYLIYMVRNQCLDYLRKAKSIKNLHQKIQNKEPDVNSLDALISHEFEEKIVGVLASLPERCRIAFEYSRFEELSYKEIAGKMNISTKAVEALISRALKTFRKELKEYLPGFIFF